jgi:mannose-6-phosphate isomerase-like protein (cupin superfamily)
MLGGPTWFIVLGLVVAYLPMGWLGGHLASKPVPARWKPHIIADLNGQQVKLAKFFGEFIWHHHATEDELFLVLRRTLTMPFRDRVVTVNEGECIVVPRGVEHKPVADGEAHVLLFEPAGTLNTGNVRNERTVQDAPRLSWLLENLRTLAVLNFFVTPGPKRHEALVPGTLL